MSKKELTVYDATKDEIIEFCFNQMEVRGVLLKEQFLAWLWKKRNDELLDATEKTIEASQKHLHEYIDLVKQANDEPELEKKLILFEKANKAYSLYEKSEKAYKELDKQYMDSIGVN